MDDGLMLLSCITSILAFFCLLEHSESNRGFGRCATRLFWKQEAEKRKTGLLFWFWQKQSPNLKSRAPQAEETRGMCVEGGLRCPKTVGGAENSSKRHLVFCSTRPLPTPYYFGLGRGRDFFLAGLVCVFPVLILIIWGAKRATRYLLAGRGLERERLLLF